MTNQVIAVTIPIKKEYFDMIYSRFKPEEYRDIKPYWVRRLIGNWHQYISGCEWLYPSAKASFREGEYMMPYMVNAITFVNGYTKDAPRFTIEWLGIEVKRPNPEWAPIEFCDQLFFTLRLGKIIEPIQNKDQ